MKMNVVNLYMKYIIQPCIPVCISILNIISLISIINTYEHLNSLNGT